MAFNLAVEVNCFRSSSVIKPSAKGAVGRKTRYSHYICISVIYCLYVIYSQGKKLLKIKMLAFSRAGGCFRN